MTEEEQSDLDPHLEWAAEGAILLARTCPVLVVVDVLRFTTTVEVAVSQGAVVVPLRWPGRGPGDGDRAAAAAPGPSGLARPGLSSLSPVSMLGVPTGSRVALTSPNGAGVALTAAAGAVVLAGCLRNASAVAAAARAL
ncbi:MAG TPA: hypothetical protein VG637_03685, partial [Actinomycetes bacterium]|nr:hypothetical protein [Actinomycetes bacterium]